MSDTERRCNSHRTQHVSGVEMTDHHPVTDVCPGCLSNQRQFEILFRRKTALSRHNQAGAIQQWNESQDQLHFSSLAAVTTLCATSASRRFSFIAALRSSP